MRRSRAGNSSPMWYTAAAEYAVKRQKILNRTSSCGRAWNEHFFGQGNRLQQPQVSLRPCCRAARKLENTNRSKSFKQCRPTARGISQSTSSTAPQMVDVQIPVYNIRDPCNNRNIFLTAWNNGPSLQTMNAMSGPEIVKQTDESNESKIENNITRTPYKHSNMLPIVMVESNVNNISPEETLNVPAIPSSTEAETAKDDPSSSLKDGAGAATVGSEENNVNVEEMHYKPDKAFQSFHGEHPAAAHYSKSKVLDGNMLATCEVTEAHFISFDCDQMRQADTNQLDMNSNWHSAQQLSLPQYGMYPKQLGKTSCMAAQKQQQQTGCNSNAYANWQNNDSAWRRPSCRSHQQAQTNCPNCNSCYSLCSHQQQQTTPNGLTELLAQQLQNQMKQAQVQIAQMQLQLDNVCGASRPQQIEDFTQATTTNQIQCDFQTQPLALDSAETTIAQSVKCPAHVEQSSNDPQNLVAPPPVMALGFYAITSPQPQQSACEKCEPQRRCCASTAPPAAHNQQSTDAPQQYSMPCPHLQHQQQQLHQNKQQQPCQQQQQHQRQCMHSAQFPSSNYNQSCCRQRYAQMRFMLPRYWQGH